MCLSLAAAIVALAHTTQQQRVPGEEYIVILIGGAMSIRIRYIYVTLHYVKYLRKRIRMYSYTHKIIGTCSYRHMHADIQTHTRAHKHKRCFKRTNIKIEEGRKRRTLN